MRIYFQIAFLLFVSIAAAQAQIYRVVTPDGRTIYTDSPPEDADAEEVELPELIIEPATELQQRNQASSSTGAAGRSSSVSDQRLPVPEIVRPSEQQVVPPGQRQVSVAAQVSQELPAGFRFILLINGEVVGGPVTSPVWTVQNPNPGQQLAQVAIVDNQGSRRVLSAVRTFFVIR